MLRHNSPKRDKALEELRDIVGESIGKKDPHRSHTQLFNWTKKYLNEQDWHKTKRFWRKIL